jgi:hypothetical protein
MDRYKVARSVLRGLPLSDERWLLDLKQFYENVGFKVHGEIYEEDGFPH